jgi:hypothetical protein
MSEKYSWFQQRIKKFFRLKTLFCVLRFLNPASFGSRFTHQLATPSREINCELLSPST